WTSEGALRTAGIGVRQERVVSHRLRPLPEPRNHPPPRCLGEEREERPFTGRAERGRGRTGAVREPDQDGEDPMRKATRPDRSGHGPRSGVGSAPAEAVSPRVREMVEDLHAVCDAIESGVPLERAATVRTIRINPTIPAPSPEEIRAIRGSLGLS